MKGIRYTDDFKSSAVKQISDRGHKLADIAKRLGVSTKSLYKWQQEISGQKQGVVDADVAILKQEVAREALNKSLFQCELNDYFVHKYFGVVSGDSLPDFCAICVICLCF